VEQLPFSVSQIPLVFTDYRKKIESSLETNDIISRPLSSPVAFPKKIDLKLSFSLVHLLKDTENVPLIFSGGEKSAQERLKKYLFADKNILTYKETRNGMLEFDDSTKLSPWLALGVLSAKRIYSELKRFESHFESNSSTYWLFFELLWRDYFKHFSIKYQDNIFKRSGISQKPMVRSSLSSAQIKLNFENWKTGKTSKDFINANMLELAQTGWMSNRGRQNVASFLIHDLEVPWTWGASYFEEMLIDYDCESNWGNWLYLSGRGSDPRSRVFNIDKQANDYDALGAYRKKWLS
jgi:deoxyribodipyrimidine photo-lyase